MTNCVKKKTLLTDAVDLLKNGTVICDTNMGSVSLSLKNCRFDGRKYTFENTFAYFTVNVFDKGGETAYKTVEIECKTDLILYRVSFFTASPLQMQDLIFYKSFIDAPAAGFLRCGPIGFYIGAENPFFSVVQRDGDVVVTYEPSLILKAGESYESDAQFIGGYICSGELVAHGDPINLESIQSGIKRTRFFDPCCDILLDRAEIKAMRTYVAEYYAVINRRFDNILYYFFYPHSRVIQTEEQERACMDQIDRFARLEGDIIVFNPHSKTALPTEEKMYWELLPENSSAQKIFDHATQKGLRCGYYMGCAFNGEFGNAALLPFMPQKTAWKKVDSRGNIAEENCLACDEYLDWWYTVQANTIAKYDLGYWAWDPGPGNGNECFASNHGHIPGKGEYKGWRNSLLLLERLKTRFPDLFLQSFYGRKEYGHWGFKYFTQHEIYWEQTLLYGATLHRDFSDYRINAHGTRLQNLWSMQHRFLPAELGHGLVTRMGESFFDPDIDKANDHVGWKYSLISAIAYCGSVTHCNLPDRLENLPDIEAFYHKWISWARENYEYCKYATPISDDVADGVIDGIARINRDKGQVFLFNSSPWSVHKQVILDEKLGFDTDREFYFHVLYCERYDFDKEPVTYNSAYRMGDVLDITLPPYGAVVLEMAAQPTTRSIDKIPYVNHTVSEYLLPDGNRLCCKKHSAYESVILRSNVYISTAMQDALRNAFVPNEKFLYEKINEWREQGIPFNFSTSFANRLLVYIPIRGVKMPRTVELSVNGRVASVETLSLRGIPVLHYAFVEELVKWGHENEFLLRFEGLAENSFLGMYFEFPDAAGGLKNAPIVVDEEKTLSSVHHDRSLIIDSLSITPEGISDEKEFCVRVETAVPYEQIQAVYFLHPTIAQMPRLSYDAKEKCWQGVFKTGKRRLNIFCNTEVSAWIKAKNGGVGPKVYKRLPVFYI